MTSARMRIDQHAANFGERAHEVLQHDRAARLNRAGRLRFQVIQIGLNAVIVERALRLRRTRLEIVRVLWQIADQRCGLCHKRAGQEYQTTYNDDSKKQVHHGNGQQPIARASRECLHRSGEHEGQHRGKREQQKRTGEWSQHLTKHPHQRQRQEDTELHQDDFEPIPLQQPGAWERRRPIRWRGLIGQLDSRVKHNCVPLNVS